MGVDDVVALEELSGRSMYARDQPEPLTSDAVGICGEPEAAQPVADEPAGRRTYRPTNDGRVITLGETLTAS
jgi:hypothetical protein